MCRTPAPPSTAFVAANIWSGTGDVKTAPGHAASSMPLPTKPPCSGSWPEAPPATRGNLPLTGASLRRTTWLAASIRTRSGWAAPSPASDSWTTSSAALMNFFIVVGATTLNAPPLRGGDGRLAGAVRFGDGFLDRACDLPRRRHPVVGEDGHGRADQVGGDVREQLLHPVVHAAVDGGDEQIGRA